MINGEGQGKERKAPPVFPAIDEEIKRRGSVRRFVAEAGIHEQTYYAMQSGKTQPTLNTIYQILRYTGLTFDDAFGDNKNAVQRVQDAERRRTHDVRISNSSRHAY